MALRSRVAVSMLVVCAAVLAGASLVGARPVSRRCLVAKTRHQHRHCVAIPKGVTRPHHRPEQAGPKNLIPIPQGGGLGGSGFDPGESAIAWAQSLRGNTSYAWYCERFVENAFNTSGRYPSAWAAATALGLHGGAAPRGALVFFRPNSTNDYYGHIGISLGGGQMVSALSSVQDTSIVASSYWSALYGGWAYAPASWPGRNIVPLTPPNNTTPSPTPSVQLVSPLQGQVLSGIVTLVANVSNASGVEFDAYYATDPNNIGTVGWHKLGVASNTGGGTWTMPFDTHAIPDQGNAGWGTVNVAAIPLDSNGNQAAARDYRLVSISNLSPPPPAMVIDFTSSAPQPTTVRGTITLSAKYPGAGGMEFDAYYATDPANITTTGWHALGKGGNIGGGTWTLGFDTHAIPNQGNAGWGTVNLVAIVVDGGGHLTSTRYYSRVTVAN
jgi:NlpC/P60 family